MIVPMEKITFIGLETEKEPFLEQLQAVGVAHLIYPHEPIEALELTKELARVTETRKFLSSRSMGEKSEKPLSHRMVCDTRDELARQETRIQAEIAALKKEIALQEVWGDFRVDDLDALRKKGLHVYFYKVPQKIFEDLPLENLYYQIVNTAKGEICFVTVSADPPALNIPEEKIPITSLSDLQERLTVHMEELRKIEEKYAKLAAHLDTLVASEAELTDLLEYRRAVINAGTELDGRLFIVTCWSPIPEEDLIQKIGTPFSLYHFTEKPSENDRVPVLLSNRSMFESGEDLVKVYSYPSYQDFDPSGFVLYCFAVFFGMIVGDAGYGLTLLAVTVLLRKRFGTNTPFASRFFRLMFLVSFTTIAYGILSAGYFGIRIAPENPLSRAAFLDFNTKEGQNQIMILSILFGMVHISLSLIIKFKNTRDYAALGWVPVIWGGYFLVNSRMGKGMDNPPALYTLILGFLVVFLFSSKRKNVFLRLLEGLNGLLGVVQIFSDVLSYLRLFALGIATVYMAQTFNVLADNIVQGLSWIGYLLAVPLLFVGHFINLLLGVMGGVIHGLRLNFLEWYRWCFEGDGLVYRPFRKTIRRD
jgi:V/A-type H+-transporting ATPase subunit I